MTRAENQIRPFGTLADGRRVDQVTLSAKGIEIVAITYGAIIVSVHVPDRNGVPGDVVLGHDTLDAYVTSSPYFGAVVGRYGNRIAGGRLALGARSFQLSQNDKGNCLHGGNVGFDKAVWNIIHVDDTSVELGYISADGDQGFPGELSASVKYTLTDRRELSIEYTATTNKLTVVNLTQHSYWNLAEPRNADILNHELSIRAERFILTDAELIPTGTIAPVAGTPFDFRMPSKIGSRIQHDHPQLVNGAGYDHSFVLDSGAGVLTHAAFLQDGASGRWLRVATTEPGLQLYTGNRLDGRIVGKRDVRYSMHAGVCLETQHFPDSPNHTQFPSTTLEPGQRYASRTVFSFGAE
jgi:aldose 1-epimerase